MDDAALVNRMRGSGQHFDQVGRCRHIQGTAVEQVGQIGSVDVLHREVGMRGKFADVIDRHNVGMLQPGQGQGLGAKAVELLRCDRSGR